jgi:hypothetical protein
MTPLQNQVMALRHKGQMQDIVQYIGVNQARFSQLVELVTSGNPELARRAAWPLSNCVSRHPNLVKPHLTALIDRLEKPCHAAVSRNILRLLQEVPVPESEQGRLMNYCFSALAKRDVPAANKAFSLTILAGLATHYPEIREEILLCIEDQLPGALPSFRSRAQKITRQLNGLLQAGHSKATDSPSGLSFNPSSKPTHNP